MSSLKDNPLLQKTLSESPSLTIFCGAGVSSALSKQTVTWSSWLKQGVSYIPPEQQQIITSKIDEGELVDAAGELLRLTKEHETYKEWMNSSFSGLTIQDEEFSECFTKMHRLGDRIVTTNYDMLLEAATATDTLTYNHPDKVLEVIRQESKPQIIHIHGAYSELAGIDDIIADEDQYNEIIQNQGAQFLQNLLGINPIIFIGCGQTMDDPNISRFITFANQHLNIEVPYFYLYKEGEDISTLGDHIEPIIYGDDYDDLPIFLRTMVDYRLQQRYLNNRLIELTPYEESTESSGSRELYYFANSRHLSFTGRDVELKELQRFISSSTKSGWWAITGEAGIGKSRLAYETLKQLPSDWFGFFLRSNLRVEDIQEFVPFNNTVVIIEDIQANYPANIILALLELFWESKFKLRLILIERDNMVQLGGWYQELINKMSAHESATFISQAYRQPENIVFGGKIRPSKAFLNLGPLEKASSLSIIKDFGSRLGLQLSDGEIYEIYESYLENVEVSCHRPLFLQIFIEYWLENEGHISPMNKEDLFSRLILKEQQRWLSLLNNRYDALSELTQIISLACAVNYIDVKDLEKPYSDYWSNVQSALELLYGEQKKQKLAVFLRELSQKENLPENVLSPQYLDMVKAFIVHFYTDEDDYIAFAEEAWEYGADGFVHFTLFLSRALEDFEEFNSFQKMIGYLPEKSYHYFYLVTLINSMNYIQDLHLIEQNLEKVRIEDELIAANLIEAWFRLGNVYTTKDDYEKLKFCADNITEICSRSFGYEQNENRKLSILLCIEHLSQFINAFLNNQQYTTAEKYISYLESLQELDPFQSDDGLATDIAEVQKAAFITYVEIKDWENAIKKLESVQSVYERFPLDEDNAEIFAYCLQRTCFHLGDSSDKQKDINKWVRDLSQLNTTFPDNRKVTEALALTLANRVRIEFTSKRNQKDIAKIKRLNKKQPEFARVAGALAKIYRDRINYKLDNGSRRKEINSDMQALEKLHKKHPDEGSIQSCYLIAYFLIHFATEHKSPTTKEIEMYKNAAEKFDEYEEIRDCYMVLTFSLKGKLF